MPPKSSSFDLDAFNRDIAARIREAITGKRGSIAAAARRYGIPATTIRQYYAGINPPSAAFLARMCEVDGVSAKWLITGQGPQKTDQEADAAAAVISAMPPIQRDLMLTIIGGVRSTGKG